ncbi:MAG TPA: LysR substrate-binding domain-containing protein [Aestuariivirga sp.]|nr:LysR substrate-binding domain-containing protein [Aestuariivirga sp.]
MEMRQLRYFVQIVECGSLSKASVQLHVAQPALSQQLARLEEEIGRPLMIRSARGVRPTDSGLALYHHARFTIRQFDQMLSAARSHTDVIQGMVTVGLPATTVATAGLSLVRRVRARYPKILLNVVEGMSGHLAQLMRLGQFDLAVLFRDDVAEGLRVEPLFSEELFVIAKAGSAFVPPDCNALSIAAVARLPLILPTGAHGLRQRIDAEMAKHELTANVVAEIDSLALVMSCVHNDMGATIKPLGAILQEGERGRPWLCLPFADATIRRSSYLYSLPPERQTTAAALVAAELREIAAELATDKSMRGFELLGAR